MRTRNGIGFLACSLFLAARLDAATPPPAATAAAGSPAGSGYHLAQTVAVAGDGGWDYLAMDDGNRRLYVSHSDRVAVLDADRLTQVGEIPGQNGVHGIAIAPDLGRGFISNGKSNLITVFELETLKVIGEWKSTGENPDAILFEPTTARVFAFNGRSANATVFEAKDGTVLATLPLGGKPEFATADLKGNVYVNIEDRSELATIDARKLTVTSRAPLAPCTEPSGMAIDRAHRRLLIACDNKLAAIVNADNGKVVATVPIGDGVDGAAFDAKSGLGFTSNGEGTLTVIEEQSADSFRVLENVPTRKGARTLTVDETTHRVFLSTATLGAAPAATAEQPRPRPAIAPGSFVVLVLERK